MFSFARSFQPSTISFAFALEYIVPVTTSFQAVNEIILSFTILGDTDSCNNWTNLLSSFLSNASFILNNGLLSIISSNLHNQAIIAEMLFYSCETIALNWILCMNINLVRVKNYTGNRVTKDKELNKNCSNNNQLLKVCAYPA
jgi:membrane-bound acyltransferase YfiQ involved in biofilm formation